MLKNLSTREREIFDFLIKGVSPKEIAHQLNITHSTVDFHRTKLYNKLGVHSIHELFAKYSTNGKEPTPEVIESYPAPKGVIISANNLGFFSTSDADVGGNSISEVFISREEIDGAAIDSVMNLKTNLARRKNGVELYASAYTDRQDIIQRLRQANGIRFKARGDGKSWSVEFQTLESTPERNYAGYTYLFTTVRDQVVTVDIPYSSLLIPAWWEQYKFDFIKERIRSLVISAGVWLQGYGSSLLQIFDFEIY